MKEYSKHYEQSVIIRADPQTVFAYADDHRNFSSHMNKSSWMMGGGSMKTETDQGKGQKVGSHIKMSGTVFGVDLFLDEVVVKYEPPLRKAWETVGNINLIVIDHYKLGFEITSHVSSSNLKVYIDYDLPKTGGAKILGQLFGSIYAKWCVVQMAIGTKKHFESPQTPGKA